MFRRHFLSLPFLPPWAVVVSAFVSRSPRELLTQTRYLHRPFLDRYPLTYVHYLVERFVGPRCFDVALDNRRDATQTNVRKDWDFLQLFNAAVALERPLNRARVRVEVLGGGNGQLTITSATFQPVIHVFRDLLVTVHVLHPSIDWP